MDTEKVLEFVGVLTEARPEVRAQALADLLNKWGAPRLGNIRDESGSVDAEKERLQIAEIARALLYYDWSLSPMKKEWPFDGV